MRLNCPIWRHILLSAFTLPMAQAVRAELLVDGPGRFAVEMDGPVKRGLKQDETDSGTVVICDLSHRQGDTLLWVTYSDYPAGTLDGRNRDKIYDRWAKGDAATNHGTLRSNAGQRLGDVSGREFIIDLESEKKVIRARLFIVKDRTYRVWYSGPAGSEGSPAALHFLNSFCLIP